MNSDAVKESLKMAEKLANDPKALEAFQSKMLAAMQGNAEDGTESARTGLETLAASVQDPSGLMQAMDMLKDPAVVKEVESLVILWTGYFSPPLSFTPPSHPFHLPPPLKLPLTLVAPCAEAFHALMSVLPLILSIFFRWRIRTSSAR